MLASAIELEPDDFQRCCVNARVMAGMLGTHAASDLAQESGGDETVGGGES